MELDNVYKQSEPWLVNFGNAVKAEYENGNDIQSVVVDEPLKASKRASWLLTNLARP